MSDKVVVVIPSWNGRQYLEMCLLSIVEQTYSGLKVILVDNGSTDGSVEFVSERFPRVEMIRNEENLGFAYANNQAIRASESEYVATANDDVQLDPYWLEEMVRVAECHPEVGMFASKVLHYYRREIVDSAGIWVDRLGTAWNRLWGERDAEDDREPVEVFGPCAAAALYRREMLDEIGLFDETFFAYLEDADLAWRARLAGWKCLYVPAARAYHIHSATGGMNPELKRYLLARNRIWMIAKNYPAPQVLLNLLPIMLFDLASLLYHLCLRRDPAALNGRLAAAAGLAPILRKRRQVQKNKRVPFSTVAKLFKPFPNPLKVFRAQEWP